MTLDELRQISSKMNAEIDAVYKKYGFTVTHRKGTVNDHTGQLIYKTTLQDVNHKDINGNAANAEQIHYRDFAAYYGLPADGIGRQFISNGRQYTIVGLKNSRAKRILIAENERKTRYVFEPKAVVTLLAS